MLRLLLRDFGATLLEQPAALVPGGSRAGLGAQSASRVCRRLQSTATSSGTWRSPVSAAARPMERLQMSVARVRPPKAQPSYFWTAARPRRTFHCSRPRRSQTQKDGGAKKEAGSGSAAEPQTLSARMKKLSREYGWTAVGVYLGLSLLDFPFCFLLVRTLGTEKIAAAEHYVVDHIKAVIPESAQTSWRNYRSALKEAKKESGNATDADDVTGWGVEEADKLNRHEASLATQLALAYAIHKSFIFIRVPLTAAVTPKVVKVLRSWGWKIGKQTPK